MRRATQRLVDAFELFAISIHALHEESDSSPSAMRWWRTFISIHALHEESDSNLRCADKYNWLFQSTLSMRRATPSTATMRPVRSFQSTLSMRRATQSAQMSSDLTLFQSTLSMRRATGRQKTVGCDNTTFQSTLSMRRATVSFDGMI